jgi:hypothetical protein
MEGPSSPANSARPRRRRRWLILLVILAAAVASYWVLPWLLMPEDLRRMQGVWNIVKFTEGEKERRPQAEDSMQIIGTRLLGRDDDWYEIRVAPPEKRIYFYRGSATEYELLGIKIRLPLALTRPSECVCLEYQLTDRQLVLRIKGMMDVATGQVMERPDEPQSIHFERPLR